MNLDRLLYAGFDADLKANAETVLQTFRAFIEENRDEIIALRIVYDQRYADRPMAIRQLQALYEKLMQRHVTAERLWDCYAIKQPDKVKKGVLAQLTDLIAMIRFELGLTDRLTPFADLVGHNFQQWTLRRNAGNVHFTEEQMVWLRKIRDQIAVSLSITEEDLDLNPFDRMGGLGRFYELFGEEYLDLMNELNVELVG